MINIYANLCVGRYHVLTHKALFEVKSVDKNGQREPIDPQKKLIYFSNSIQFQGPHPLPNPRIFCRLHKMVFKNCLENSILNPKSFLTALAHFQKDSVPPSLFIGLFHRLPVV
jgi:hypothetical protein